MKFIDEAIITVQSGNGGRGCVSFRREKFVPRGGPDGGDGGKGGDVVLLTTSRKRTLYQFRFKRQFKAQNGSHGQGKQKTGNKKSFADMVFSEYSKQYFPEEANRVRDQNNRQNNEKPFEKDSAE